MSYNYMPPTRRTPEQIENEQRESLFAALMRNDETLKELIDLYLEETLKCARIGNWRGMDHCLRIYAQQESNRLKARLALMEREGIEIYRSNPYTAQETSLLNELFGLLRTFLQSAEEHHAKLVDRFNANPTGPNSSDVYSFKRMAGMCAEHYSWLASLGTSEVQA